MIFQINALTLPTLLLFSFFLFLLSRKTFHTIKDAFPLAPVYLYVLSFTFWWVSPFFPHRWADNPLQANLLLVTASIVLPLWFAAFRFLLRLSWAEALSALVIFGLAHVVTAALNLCLLASYRFQEGLGKAVTFMVTMEGLKNNLAWAWRETGVAFLLFLLLFRLFSTREEAGELMALPLWHFTAWFAALILWNLLWVYEAFLDLPVFLERYFLVWFLQILVITVLCVPFFKTVNKVPLPVAGRMAWAFLMANLGGLGFRLLLLFGTRIH
jgi:hypothetical protein